jgi:hypothetical protein
MGIQFFFSLSLALFSSLLLSFIYKKMVSIKSFLATSVVLVAAFVNVEAAVSPTYPSPGAIETEGKAFDITWSMYYTTTTIQLKSLNIYYYYYRFRWKES